MTPTAGKSTASVSAQPPVVEVRAVVVDGVVAVPDRSPPFVVPVVAVPDPVVAPPPDELIPASV